MSNLSVALLEEPFLRILTDLTLLKLRFHDLATQHDITLEELLLCQGEIKKVYGNICWIEHAVLNLWQNLKKTYGILDYE